jgi:DNA polymerase type B, organellar and viral
LTNVFYKGILPKLEYWTGITTSEYEYLHKQYSAITGNFRDEAIKYCKLDCQCLHEILIKFNELIFKQFNVNISYSLTLPALAMRIYKSQFMPKDTIYQLLGEVEANIRQSYTGGAVDVFIPHNRVENFFNKVMNKLFYYDVNSLYPFIMANTPMPVGKPVFFEGDIRSVEPKAFGFFYCKITSPDYLEHPILQRRIKTSEGLRTIAGLGSWNGWIFSGELDNAVRFGYTFEIIKGYQFEKGFIFKDYVNKMYELRLHYTKGHPMNLIAKLLMNSLYGKFGMKLESTRIEMFDTSNETDNEIFNDMLEVYGETIQDYIQIDSHFLTVRQSTLHYKYNEDEDMFHGLDVNIGIASAITAGGRMWISQLKNNSNFNLYYSDTDSAVIDQPLPDFMVGKDLGQLKLEHTIERAVFLAPKVYGFINSESEEIIKVKGVVKELLSDIHIQDLEQLLYKDSTKEFTQSKWFKKVIEGEITVEDVAYTLKVTSNKRAPMYVNNVFENTKPFYYDDLLKLNYFIKLTKSDIRI